MTIDEFKHLVAKYGRDWCDKYVPLSTKAIVREHPEMKDYGREFRTIKEKKR